MIEKKEAKRILDKAPNEPGVYKMHDDEDRIIYIGKAKDLKKRLSQYFQSNYQHSTRTKKLLEKTTKLTFTTVDTELEAKILELNQIKHHKPKYNVIMKDDKNYVYIKITKEDFPRVQIVRKVDKDDAKYYGPKTAAHKVNETFKVIKKIFPFRHCNLDIEETSDGKVIVTRKTIKYPCLDYYIKRCCAPCVPKCNKSEYAEIIENVKNFLEGRADGIIGNLKKQMQQFATAKEFEKAAKLRDKIQKVEDILEKQNVSAPSGQDQDIINYVITHGNAYFNLFQVRDGKLIGQENFILTAKEIDDPESEEVLEAFLTQYYEIATDIPKEILIPHNVSANPGPKITVPQQGKKEKLLEMSLNNARIYADRNKPSWQQESELTKAAAEELQTILKLPAPLKRIECYDISHLSGTETVGSMIVFENGAPKKDHYRKFRLRTVQNKPDDYKSMEEILMRRLGKIATDLHAKEYIFKKALKKNDNRIQEECKKAGLNKTNQDYKAFHILVKGNEMVAFGKIKDLNEKVSSIHALWVDPNERGKKLGHKMLKFLIKKAKNKRVYLICKDDLKEYYQILGFEDVKKVPTELEKIHKRCNKTCPSSTLIFDKNKHKTDESFTSVPDLLVIDGGKGQLKVAEKVLNNLNLKIPHVSLAKRLEEIFEPGKKSPTLLDRTSEALKLLQRARDEAHRFAITYNKKLRSKKFSQLTS